jgi:hypothetical protein
MLKEKGTPVIASHNEISEVTRRNLFDQFTIMNVHWAGKLTDDQFLARLYDLTEFSSTDPRYRTALADIHQHRVNWRDWEDDWVFYDSRFKLLKGPDNDFLRFLCETIHPVVRPDTAQVRHLQDCYNEHLRADGWEIAENVKLSGAPVFLPRKIGQRVEFFHEPTGWEKVDRQLQEARLRLDTASTEEQFQTVGLICRETLISLAQTIYNPEKHQPIDEKIPSDTDASRMLQAFFGTELMGNANEESRAHAKAALRLAVGLQHKRTADFRMAALCAEATVATVNIVAIVTGRRG